MLQDMAHDVPTATNVSLYAQQVRFASKQRRALELAVRIRQIAIGQNHLGVETGTDHMMELLAAQTVALEQLVDEDLTVEHVPDLYTWDDLLAREPDADDWVIPDLVDRQDVVMILGGEGAGKSWISRQIAQCLTAGVHPFRPRVRIPAKRTLLVDLEVAESTLVSETRPMSYAVKRFGEWAGADGFVWHHPEGLNLRDRKDALLFEQVVSQVQPDMVLFGSLYNAYATGRDSHEQVADELKLVFNRIRTRYRCALWLEHHMPKGDGVNRPTTPFGSSVWTRWITHGRAMKEISPSSFELAKFRGDRGVREFPAGIIRNGLLPVSPIWDQAEIDLAREAGR